MISTNQFKNGNHIEVEGTVFKIIEFQHVKPGKGGAFVRTKLRRIEDGSVIDKTFRAGEKFRLVRTETRKMQDLYDSGDAQVFMDAQSYDQLELQADVTAPNGISDLVVWSTTLDPEAFRGGVTVRVPIPADAPPTVAADKVGVAYRLRALVDRPLRSDLAVERAIAII